MVNGGIKINRNIVRAKCKKPKGMRTKDWEDKNNSNDKVKQ